MKYKTCPKCGKKQSSEWEKCEECGYFEGNLIASIIRMASYIILFIGVVASFVFAVKNPVEIGYLSQKTFNWKLLLIYLIPSSSCGLLMLGISEIIYLNQKLFDIFSK